MKKYYEPSITERWPDNYFKKRLGNDINRLKQFDLDKKLIKKYFKQGNICDVGCSTGEFLKYLGLNSGLYGMEINKYAKKQASKFINFKKNIFTERNFFNLVIFRGTIQHVDEPFRMMKEAHKSLKKKGLIIFLATPNSNSILYKLKNNLSFLDKKTNFYIPGDIELKNTLENFGFKVLEINYPYLDTPYVNLIRDHLLFILNMFSKNFFPHPFWKSSMNIVAQKK